MERLRVASLKLFWRIPANFSPNIDICMLPAKEEPSGGIKEPVVIRAAVVDKLPNWAIVYPIACPYQTQGYYTGHRGIDLINRGCTDNRWVVAVDKGEVIWVGWISGYGYRIEILHENGFTSTYSHLSQMDVVVGNKVGFGQKIGLMGSTGHSTGVHLHFELIYQGVKINPVFYLGNR